jgi:Protein of unknown function (DUF3024)
MGRGRNDAPARVVGQVRYDMDVDGRWVTILECRPPWQEECGPESTGFPVARLRYTTARRAWSLYWQDRNLKFHLCDLVEPTPDVETLLAEIDHDPTCIFWG